MKELVLQVFRMEEPSNEIILPYLFTLDFKHWYENALG